MKKIGIAVGMLLLASPAFAAWEYRQTKDEMTDKIEHEAELFNTTADARLSYGCQHTGEPVKAFALTTRKHIFKKGGNLITFRFDDRPSHDFYFLTSSYFSKIVFHIYPDSFFLFLLEEAGAKKLRIRVEDGQIFTFDNAAFGEAFRKMSQVCDIKIPRPAK